MPGVPLGALSLFTDAQRSQSQPLMQGMIMREGQVNLQSTTRTHAFRIRNVGNVSPERLAPPILVQ
jgi:hypothetical protein